MSQPPRTPPRFLSRAFQLATAAVVIPTAALTGIAVMLGLGLKRLKHIDASLDSLARARRKREDAPADAFNGTASTLVGPTPLDDTTLAQHEAQPVDRPAAPPSGEEAP